MKGAWWLRGKNHCRARTVGHGEIYRGKQVGVRCCKDTYWPFGPPAHRSRVCFVKIVIDRATMQYTPTVTVDSITQVGGAVAGPSPAIAGVDVGLLSTGPMATLTLFVDNVVMTTK